VSVSRETREGVSRETLERLQLFHSVLLRWNARINLVSSADAPHIWSRHIADALQLRSLIPADAQRGVDLGSGAGFPGLVLAIATKIPFDLIESDQRKAAFLREAARITCAPCTIHASRIESATLAPAPLITARALAPLSVLLELATPLLAPGGFCLFPKGESAEKEIAAASASWTMRIERHISTTDRSGVILRISEVLRV